jgi:hypothetical protein
MKKLACLGMLASLVAVPAAFAGYKESSTLVVTRAPSGAVYVEGSSLGEVRNSSNSTEFVGCYLAAGSGLTAVQCMARSSNGTVGVCYSYAPEIVAAVQTLTDASAISFVAKASDGSCESVQVRTISSLVPPRP